MQILTVGIVAPLAAIGQGVDRREDVVFRGAYIMTMDALGDIAEGDVLVQDGRIADVGLDLEAPGAREIDGRGRILMPGLVDTHTHLWLSQMRGLFSRSEETKYFPLVDAYGPHFRPLDMRIGTLFGAAGNLDAGITTTVAFCDNIRSPEMAESALKGLKDAGIRARFIYTGSDTLPANELVDLDHLRQLRGNWSSWSNVGLLSLGFGWRVPARDASKAVVNRALQELDFARGLGLPISSHISGDRARAQLDFLIDRELLGDDLLLVHATDATDEQLKALAANGCALSLTPITEQRVGFGLTFINHFDHSLDRIGLGIDGALAGAPSMFAVMQMLHNVQAGKGGELAVLPRRILKLATIDGARALGMDEEIGSIRAGKRADLVLVKLEALNMGPVNQDPSALLVYSAQPENVETVMVDGVVVKQDGELTRLSSKSIFRDASESLMRIQQRAAGED